MPLTEFGPSETILKLGRFASEVWGAGQPRRNGVGSGVFAPGEDPLSNNFWILSFSSAESSVVRRSGSGSLLTVFRARRG